MTPATPSWQSGDSRPPRQYSGLGGHLHPQADALLTSENDSTYGPASEMDMDVVLTSDSQVYPGDDLFEKESGQRVAMMRARCQTRAFGLETSLRQAHGDDTALAREILDGQKYTEHGWCRLANLEPTKKGGYVQLSWEGANKFATAGEVCLWAQGVSKPVQAPEVPKDYIPEGSTVPGWTGRELADASHRCNHPRCLVWDHVCLESHTANEARKGCPVWVTCSLSCRECDGGRVIFLCPHVPCCIRAHPGYAGLDDLMTNGICRNDSKDTERFLAAEVDAAVVGLKVKA